MNRALILRRQTAAALFATCIAVAGWAGATTALCAEPAAVVVDDSLYRALGGRLAIERVVADLTRRLIDDPRSAAMFKDVDLAQFRTRLADQLCEVAGGPCVYAGKDMKTVHAGFDINRTHFNAVVEMLQDSMDAEHIAFRDQNRLLARLAPMHRDIVNAGRGATPVPSK